MQCPSCQCWRKADLTVEKEFAESTSLHGVRHIAGEKHWLGKTFWTLACLIAWGFLLWQLYMLLYCFGLYNTTTSLGFVLDKHGRSFPAVTLCNFNRINGTALEKDLHVPRNDTELLEYILLSFDKFYLKNKGYTEAEVDRIHEKYTKYSGRKWNFSEILNIASKTNVEDFVKECYYWPNFPDNVDCKTKSAFIPTYTSYGSCLTFNHFQGQFKVKPLFSTEVATGLSMIVDLNPDEITGTLTTLQPAFGLKIFVHGTHEPPQMIDTFGFNLRPGSYAIVGMKTEKFTSKSSPWGDCGEHKLEIYPNYTGVGCDMLCKAKYIREECQCEPLLLRSVATGMRVCELYDIQTCTSQATVDYEIMTAEGRALACDRPVCTWSCSFSEYPMSVSSADFPSPFHKQLLKKKNVSISEYSVKLDIAFSDLWTKEFRAEPSMTVNQLLGDFGGQMGLCIGASILTWAEMGQYLLIRLTMWCQHLFKEKKKKNDTPADSDGVDEKRSSIGDKRDEVDLGRHFSQTEI